MSKVYYENGTYKFNNLHKNEYRMLLYLVDV